jgi:hypothetical protein
MGHRDQRLGRVAFLKQGASGGEEGSARPAEQLAFETRLVLLLSVRLPAAPRQDDYVERSAFGSWGWSDQQLPL